MPNTIEITNETSSDIEIGAIYDAVHATLQSKQLTDATVNVAVVGNQQICDLNRKFLDHDYPTDVLSFRLSDEALPLEGDVIVNLDMATEKARSLDEPEWTAQRELALYAIHGTLHLVGFDDQDDAARHDMQHQERVVLTQLGILHEAAFVGRGNFAQGEST